MTLLLALEEINGMTFAEPQSKTVFVRLPDGVSEIDFQGYLGAIVRQSRRTEDWRDGQYVGTQAQLPLKVQTPKQPESLERGQNQEAPKKFDVLGGLREFYRREPVLLIGKPGSGKSTALRRLLLEEAQGYAERGSELIPVLILLRSCDQGKVEDWIAEALEVEVVVVRSLLKEPQPRLLLLFDGLNEVPNPEAYRSLTQFLEKSSRVPMVFTTRELGADTSLGIGQRVEMVPLTELQMLEFIELRLPGQGTTLIRQLGDRLRELAETPLLLNMLCQVFEQSGEIPQNRGELFRNKFAQDFDAIKHKGVVAADPGFFRFKDELLQHLAMKMIVGDGLPTGDVLQIDKTVAQGWLRDWLVAEQVSDAGEKARIWLEDLLEHHILQVAEKVKQIEFHHQLFQEYYAAEWLLAKVGNLDDDTLKRDYLNYLKWTEPVALMLALVDDEAFAVRVVDRSLDVDLMLCAKLTGAVKPNIQAKTIDKIDALDIPLTLKCECWLETRSKNAIPGLLKAIDNQDSCVGSRAVSILGQLGHIDVIPELLKLLRNRDSYLRSSAIGALGDLGYINAIPEMLKAIEDMAPWVRSSAAYALDKLCYVDLLPELVKALNHQAFCVRSSAALALGQLGRIDAIPKLIKALEDPNSDVRSSAALALGQLGHIDAIPKLIKALEDPSSHVRRNAASALGRLGHIDAIPALLKAISDQSSDVRHSASYALGKMGHVDAIPGLLEMLEDPEMYLPDSASDILSELGYVSTIPELLKALEDEKFLVHRSAAYILGEIGHVDVIPELLKALKHPKSFVRSDAAYVLGKINHVDAIPGLLEALEDQELLVRESVAIALGRLGHMDVIPALLEVIDYIDTFDEVDEIGQQADPQSLAELWQQLKSSDIMIYPAISTIQSRCKFYNYEIHQKALARHPQEKQQPPQGITVYGDYIANGDKIEGDKIIGNKYENPNTTEVKIIEHIDNYHEFLPRDPPT
jgi:HEAT repeat protein